MKILTINKFAHVTGGADHYSLETARLLRARGHDVMILSTEHPHNADEGRFVRLRVEQATRDALTAYEQARVAVAAVWNGEAFRAGRELMSDFRPDVVHAHKLYPQLSVAPVAAAMFAGVPVVQTLHDYEFISADPFSLGGGWLDRYETRLRHSFLNTATYAIRRSVHSRAVGAWIAPSRFTATAHKRLGHVAVLPNFGPRPSLRPASFDSRRGVVYVGALSRAKGIEDALAAATRMPALDLKIVGDGPLRNVVAAAARKHANVQYLGPLPWDRVLATLGEARVAVIPSRCDEAGSLVAVEAMAMGTAVVAYARGALPDYVAAAGAGVVLREDSVALADACVAVHEDRAAWHRFHSNGMHAAATTHDSEKHIAGLENILVNMASRRRRPR